MISDDDIKLGYGESVATGLSASLTLKVKVKASANPGTVKSWSITGSAPSAIADTGVIRIRVTK